MLLDPQSVRPGKSSQQAILVVAGQKIAEGSEEEMRRRFDSEIAAHKAIVELRVRTAEGYHTKLSRR